MKVFTYFWFLIRQYHSG